MQSLSPREPGALFAHLRRPMRLLLLAIVLMLVGMADALAQDVTTNDIASAVVPVPPTSVEGRYQPCWKQRQTLAFPAPGACCLWPGVLRWFRP